jgi:hypothetical protein
MVIYDYSPTKVELQSHIQFFSGGRCNVTLGGACYIHLTTETNAVFTGFSARLASACLIPA